jgi:hypothetical protein
MRLRFAPQYALDRGFVGMIKNQRSFLRPQVNEKVTIELNYGQVELVKFAITFALVVIVTVVGFLESSPSANVTEPSSTVHLQKV